MPTTARTRKTVTRSLSQAEVDALCQAAARADPGAKPQGQHGACTLSGKGRAMLRDTRASG